MPSPCTFAEVVRRLLKHDRRFQVNMRRGKGSHRMLSHPDIDGEKRSFPLKFHSNSTEYPAGTLAAIIRRFNLPRDIFD